MGGPKSCPRCGLTNMPTAVRCDCGYDFELGETKDSYLRGDSPQGKGLSRGFVVMAWILALAGGWIGIAVALYILCAKQTDAQGNKSPLYDGASRAAGRNLVAVSIFATVVWAIINVAFVFPMLAGASG